MKIDPWAAYASLMLCMGLSLDFRPATNQTMIISSRSQSVPLTQVLNQIGRAHDCFFTIEDARLKGPGNPHALEYQLVPLPLANKNLKDQLDELNKGIPNFTYRLDVHNPRIIHIIAAPLLRQQGYALNRRMNAIEL